MVIDGPRNELDAKAQHVARLMEGRNYSPTIGVVRWTDVTDLESAKSALQKTFEGSSPFEATYREITQEEMLTQLQEAFEYRGRRHSHGLELTRRQARRLRRTQADFLETLGQHMGDSSIILQTYLEEGLDICTVWWHFSILVLNRNGESLFVYGAASD